MLRSPRSRAALSVLLLLGLALAGFVVDLWHGPIVLALSPTHGIDTGDLPSLALLAAALAAAHRLTRGSGARGMRRRAAAASAVVLGGLLLAGLLPEPDPQPLSPAGGGTFSGVTERADADRAEPAGRWSHLAVTYDGATVRLYMDDEEVSSQPTSGSILRTTNPLWIGGNRPYGEYFGGLIDEVRIYDRALSPDQIRVEMANPIGAANAPAAPGLVGAWAFDHDTGRSAADSSGEGNRGRLDGPTWTARGRFGGALRFNGAGAVVRVPGSPSLDLTAAMTLSAWIRPAEVEAGWRTVVQRQTDAYFLMAGGGDAVSSAADDTRIGLIVAAAICLGLALAVAHSRWLEAGDRWWPPVALFLAGSAIDVWLPSSGTVVGAGLVAVYYATTARRRTVAIGMWTVAALLAAVTTATLAGDVGAELTRDDGGVARSAALGLFLVIAGLLAARSGGEGV